MIPPRNLDTYHRFDPPADRRVWELRAKELRNRILLANGLAPLPTRTPLTPKVTDTFEQDGIVVENVALQTAPGFWLCGNVYRPTGEGPFPAIVNPHGHWENGRKHREPDVDAPPAGQRKPAPGRADLVALPANLAKQGFLVLAYDMVGYNETDQVRHRSFGTTAESWSWGISEMGLQTWNSLRVVDYLVSRKDVDSDRIGATGASGGGTQVFLLAAIDPRVKVSVPVNMVSSVMQGGCICENAPGLRVGTDNPEIAALFAPKPQLLIACTGDWTRNVPTDEAPAVRRVYDLYGAGDKLKAVQFNYQHNYNKPSREAMTAFFREWLMGKAGEVSELPVSIDPARLTVRRPAGIDQEGVHAWLRRDGDAAAARGWTDKSRSRREERRTWLALSLAVDVPASLRNRGSGRTVLVVGTDGDPRVGRLVQVAQARGERVRLVTLPAVSSDQTALWKDFHATYNRTMVGDRVQSVLDAVTEERRSGTARVDLVGVGEAGAWCLMAKAVAPKLGIVGLSADLDNLPVSDDRRMVERLYAPALRRLGDLRTALLLAAPGPFVLHNGGNSAPWDAALRSSGARWESGEVDPTVQLERLAAG
jgi:hypothetical protein